jgi:hypothetical protein
MQLADRFGAIDVTLLEAALLRHEASAGAPALDLVAGGVAQCRAIMQRHFESLTTDVSSPLAIDAVPFLDRSAGRRRTIGSVQWRACASVDGSDGQHRALMRHVEGIIEAGMLAYAVPEDLAAMLQSS